MAHAVLQIRVSPKLHKRLKRLAQNDPRPRTPEDVAVQTLAVVYRVKFKPPFLPADLRRENARFDCAYDRLFRTLARWSKRKTAKALVAVQVAADNYEACRLSRRKAWKKYQKRLKKK